MAGNPLMSIGAQGIQAGMRGVKLGAQGISGLNVSEAMDPAGGRGAGGASAAGGPRGL